MMRADPRAGHSRSAARRPNPTITAPLTCSIR